MKLEFLSEEGGKPIRISLSSPVCHALLLGKTGSGKSVLAAQLLWMALLMGIPVAALDVVKPDGTGTFSDLVPQLGGHYRELRAGGNPLEPPQLDGISAPEQQRKLNDFKEAVVGQVLAMVLKTNDADGDVVRSLVYKAVTAFYQDAIIQQRWQSAFNAGLNTTAWQEQPTLRDLLPFFTTEVLNTARYGSTAKDVCAKILLKLEAWLERPLGQSFCQPRQYSDDSQLVIYPLQSLDPDEAPVIAQRILTEVTRNTLRSLSSLFYCDEIPVLIQHPAIAATIAKFLSTGRKEGLTAVIASQTIKMIADSPNGAQILDNLSIKLTGVINASAIPSFERIFGYPRELILPCSEQSFYPSKPGIFSRWLVEHDGLLTPARFYPNYLLLALTANQTDEMAARHRLMHEHFPNDPTKAVGTFAHLLKQSYKSGQPIQSVVDDWLLTQAKTSPINAFR